ncbi:hypothetical protein F383_36455 [Gossypium arboreum]|uniref:Uncharacterized protein n=1 Tax=Gossypium arboreum TaxID=29729 RepID=A0A0B0PKM9_GOSAR|nr:hypothetical protein F383_03766 [Gossypium arboreum]KHG30428.1 hypothetical protein F383_36455 [Gossypium arboreum]
MFMLGLSLVSFKSM